MKTVSVADANRYFSSLLRDVATGQIVTVLSRSRPVAAIVPARSGGSGRDQARRTLLIEQLSCIDVLLPAQTLGELPRVLTAKAKRSASQTRDVVLGGADSFEVADST